jgi:hypothetical protein
MMNKGSSFFLLVTIGLFSCDDSETIKSINDSKGIIFEIRVKNPSPSILMDWNEWILSG